MNKKDELRFLKNINWFHQFFDGLKQLFQMTVETIPTEYFPDDFLLSNRNFYYPRQNSVPTMPDYYVLMVNMKHYALQILAVFNPDLFPRQSIFAAEPSIVVVMHSRVNRFAYVNDYALSVIKNHGVTINSAENGKLAGMINNKISANFFAFQVPLDKFSIEQDTQHVIQEYIVDPIIEYIDNNK